MFTVQRFGKHSNLIFTNSVKIKFAHIASILTHLESKCLIHLESLIFSHLALVVHIWRQFSHLALNLFHI